MFASLLRKEILEHLLSLRFAIACLLCLTVLPASFVIRVAAYHENVGSYLHEKAADEHLVNSWSDPNQLIYHGLAVHWPPNPLSVFVRGASQHSRASAQLGAFGPLQIRHPDPRNTADVLFPSIDLVGFVGLVLSLLAIAFGFDAICGEKPRATLALLMSHPVPRNTVVLAKWLGGFITLTLPYLLSLGIIAIIASVYAGISLTADAWGRFACIAVLSVLYLAAVYSLAVWVSSLTHSPAVSVVVLLTLWTILVLAVPHLAPRAAAAWLPTPSAEARERQRVAAAREISTRMVDVPMAAYEREQDLKGDWLRHGPWYLAPKLHWWYRGFTCQRSACLARLEDDRKRREQLRAAIDEQMRLTAWLSRVSPFACFAMAAAELAGEGTAFQRRLVEQLQDFQPKVVEYGHSQWFYRWDEVIRREGHFGPPEEWFLWRTQPMPQFKLVGGGAAGYAEAAAVDVGVLAAMTAAFMVGSCLSFRRYDVR